MRTYTTLQFHDDEVPNEVLTWRSHTPGTLYLWTARMESAVPVVFQVWDDEAGDVDNELEAAIYAAAYFQRRIAEMENAA
jgi:hypothetical protein